MPDSPPVLVAHPVDPAVDPVEPVPASPPSGAEPTMLDLAAVLARLADDLLLGTTRDTHRAIDDRLAPVLRAASGGLAAPVHRIERGIAGGVYAGLGLSLRLAASGLEALAATGHGTPLTERFAGRQLAAAVNGLIGHEFTDQAGTSARTHRLGITMAPRRAGRDVGLDAAALASAYPRATGEVVVLLHGLAENEESWLLGREERGTTYAEDLAARGWTPVHLRMNTGLSVRQNGVALAALLDDLCAHWPRPVTRLALIGHSMGGLVIRSATGVVPGDRAWLEALSDIVTLGTPHCGAPLAAWAGHADRGLSGVRETAAFGRILARRSPGIRDLVEGAAHDDAVLSQVRYRLVAATLTDAPRHPVSVSLGDLLVRPESALGLRRRGRRLAHDLFAGAPTTRLHVPGADHFSLLNHPQVAQALGEWLAEPAR